ncbi:securin isoform X2 [Cuculus canorus]|uniref:securin isoform X2 n=1 Tax=Cuculus canorus TaxID=55661 RepID=UPI0023AAC166|nr:securin isoform X2 [Cuculus canorus]
MRVSVGSSLPSSRPGPAPTPERGLVNLKMPTVYIYDENDEVSATKNQRRLPSGSSKVLAERTRVNTPLPKKTITTPLATCGSARKVLGNVNRTGAVSVMEKTGQKSQCSAAKKIPEKTAGLESSNALAEDCPERENMFPYDPRDGECFELPEDLKISNLNLRGVAHIFERTYDEYVSLVPSPVDMEESLWKSNLLRSSADFCATLDDIIIDMPSLP